MAAKNSTKVSEKRKDVDFYNQHEGTTGRQDGIYLDQVENERAEEVRAYREDREPDYDAPSVTAGTPLVLKSQLAPIPNHNVNIDDDTYVEPEPETLPVDVTSAADVATVDTTVADQIKAEQAAAKMSAAKK